MANSVKAPNCDFKNVWKKHRFPYLRVLRKVSPEEGRLMQTNDFRWGRQRNEWSGERALPLWKALFWGQLTIIQVGYKLGQRIPEEYRKSY